MMRRSFRALLALACLALLAVPGGLSAQAKADVKEPSPEERQPRIANLREMTRLIRRLYPRDALREGLSDTVVMRLRIYATGLPDTASIRADSGSDPRFVAAGRRVMLRMRFEPAALDGRPVAVWIRLPIYFTIRERRRRHRSQPHDSTAVWRTAPDSATASHPAPQLPPS